MANTMENSHDFEEVYIFIRTSQIVIYEWGVVFDESVFFRHT